jgi:hypothetical protein
MVNTFRADCCGKYSHFVPEAETLPIGAPGRQFQEFGRMTLLCFSWKSSISEKLSDVIPHFFSI